MSQSLAGHLAAILEVRDGWRRVRLGDGYEGWMHEGYLDGASAQRRASRKRGARARVFARLHGASMPRAGWSARSRWARAIGTRAAIVAGGALDAHELRRRFPPDARDLRVRRAMVLEHVISVGRDHAVGRRLLGNGPGGVRAARRGAPARCAPAGGARNGARCSIADAWRAGDLLFFSDRSDGRITHVAIVAPERTLMHVAIGRGGFCGGAH